MMRVLLLGLLGLGTAGLPRGPAGSPVISLREAGESARAAWQRRDLAAFTALAGGGPLQVTLPGGKGSGPLSPRQARAILASYVQGSQEVTTTLLEAVEVDSTEGYARLGRTYRLAGLPGEREAMLLLGFRRGRGDCWPWRDL